ncbi:MULTISPECIES: efflux RND transporter periplasmic adaptor subunit [Pseudoalteromonas]|uniref:Efflux RND transporter periplasmic adaptor subunit n=1 Tax=Pseudoalteromonas rhizosphaerae TaxID=2518973 RepID=A0ABW8L1J9_9GAMM|nr:MULTISPECIES: efflux RND transporter periplasmic adaptor subunit [unclassified Pseudoalteromonas]MBB1332429.1 efflux RND transporter periplasmic adaptor subunit [Pseudoalteromonas sp. SR41-6]MBB1342451.1 efflux RND transporter periplasmic adaptor subunit [Pseudoalteromonas sp. SR45-6]MBB1415887.1 efflux RND transporter periplasmic adaptor subunit [Pseudoalteromonas sp. SG44-1]MBB1433070.1 efflux RND transporter periplasmic adaptor subunit [Pseudoalteromonas sp. SG43-6]MBB1457691.1 efflux RN
MKLRVLLVSVFITCSAVMPSAFAANVIVEPVAMERAKEQVQAVGNAEAIRSVILYPAVGDKVTAVHFKPGDQVTAGTILLELDSRRQKAALNEAKIKLADSERIQTRLQQSHAKGAVPKSDLDDAKTVYELAKVAVTKAETELEDRQVRAPFSGTMGLTDVEVGDRITTQTAIASIDDTRSLYINFNAPESAISMLRTSGNVTVMPWQGSDAINAQVAYLDSRIDPQTRTLRVKAKLDNAQAQFLPGMSFRVHIEVLGQSLAAVPEAALLWGATGPYVWKSVEQKATRVDVKIQQRLAGRLLVSGPLNEGDILVVEGVQRLRPAQELNYIKPLAAAQE